MVSVSTSIPEMRSHPCGGGERLTFYEDMYLKRPLSRQAVCSTTEDSSSSSAAALLSPPLRRASVGRANDCSSNNRHYENMEKYVRSQHNTNTKSRNSSCKSPTLYDYPPSPKPLSIKTDFKHVDRSMEHNNNYQNVEACWRKTDYLSHYSTLPLSTHKRSSPNDEHIYEVIPHKSYPQGKTIRKSHSTEENRYTHTSPPPAITHADRADIHHARQRWNEMHKPSNLKAMKRIARSMDSIKVLQGNNKLRTQSTAMAPYLWVKPTENTSLCSAASCNNITDTVLGFGRLSHGFTSLDKENSAPHKTWGRLTPEPKRRSDLSSSSGSSNLSIRRRRSDDDVSSQKSSNNSIHSTSSKSSQRRSNNHLNLQSGSKSPPDRSRPYENVQQPPTTQRGTSSNYVNLSECLDSADADVNYADLDFSDSLSKSPNHETKVISTQPSQSVSKVEVNPDTVEYTMINITATVAARRACEEHRKYRQRKSSLTASS